MRRGYHTGECADFIAWEGEVKTERAIKIEKLVLVLARNMIARDVSLPDGIIASRCLSFLLEEIDKNPKIDDEFLADAAARLVERELMR